MLLGQHFDGEPPRNLNHVFLRRFSTKYIGMFKFKNQNDGATLTDRFSASNPKIYTRAACRGRAPQASYQSVRTLQKMALLRCCGREALVHKWRTRKKEKAVCTTCQIVTLREKLKVISVEGRFVCVYLTRSCVFGILGCCFAKIWEETRGSGPPLKLMTFYNRAPTMKTRL